MPEADERAGRELNILQADLHVVCPVLFGIRGEIWNQWCLRLLVSAATLHQLARLRKAALLRISAVGNILVSCIQAWQAWVQFKAEID